jgi:PAS domain S-box-containing protein
VERPADTFTTFADLLPEPMLLVRADGTVLAGNLRFAGAFGYTRRDIAGCSLAEFVRAAPSLPDYLRRCASTRQLALGAFAVRHANGTDVPCRCEGAVLTPAVDEEPAIVLLRFIPKELSVSRFVALTQKIGELSAEISLRRLAQRELGEQRELLEVTLRSIGDAVITTDGAGRVTFMNRIAERLTGWTLTDAAGLAVEDVFHIVNEDTREPVESPAALVLASGNIVGLANHTVLIARDGIERPIDDSGAPIVDADGHLHGVVLVFRDVTELRAAQREQAAAREAAERASEAKDHFMATLSHELRTPLNAILGWSQMLTRDSVVESRRRDGLAVIERNAAHLARLVDDLLDVSRITAGQLQLRTDAVDLAGVVEATLESIRPAAAGKGLRLSVTRDGELTVCGDSGRLQQVIWNLLTNAVKFTPPGGAVEVEVARVDASARLTVRDTGDGFPPEFGPFIFDAFRQLDRSISRQHGGLGLGLTIARRLVEAHGGTIQARSPGAGGGATFVVTLPLPVSAAAS